MLKATVIIPFHRNLSQLAESLAAVRGSLPDAELLVAADGAVEDCRPLADAARAEVVVVPGPRGPAVARNRAAARASGGVLVFVDADVVVAPDALAGMCDRLAAEPDLAGVFGAYDDRPREQNFTSQFKNLAHVYVHEVSRADACTFWAGLGAIRAGAFRAVGGFDERFDRPSIEDIELGYRLVAAGYRLRLDARFRGQHLKRWTLRTSIATDVLQRGIPWTQLIYRARTLPDDLNTRLHLRLSVALTAGFVASLLAIAVRPPAAAIAAAICLGGLIALNLPCYRWLARKRGVLFALRAIPLHLVHHACNVVSLAAGTALHLANKMGVVLPGALPSDVWSPSAIPAGGPPAARS